MSTPAREHDSARTPARRRAESLVVDHVGNAEG